MAKHEEHWIDTRQVCDLLGKTPMTVFNYRNGVGRALKTSLPYYTSPRGTQRQSIFYKFDEVVRWAKKNGIMLAQLPLS